MESCSCQPTGCGIAPKEQEKECLVKLDQCNAKVRNISGLTASISKYLFGNEIPVECCAKTNDQAAGSLNLLRFEIDLLQAELTNLQNALEYIGESMQEYI